MTKEIQASGGSPGRRVLGTLAFLSALEGRRIRIHTSYWRDALCVALSLHDVDGDIRGIIANETDSRGDKMKRYCKVKWLNAYVLLCCVVMFTWSFQILFRCELHACFPQYEWLLIYSWVWKRWKHHLQHSNTWIALVGKLCWRHKSIVFIDETNRFHLMKSIDHSLTYAWLCSNWNTASCIKFGILWSKKIILFFYQSSGLCLTFKEKLFFKL